MQSSSRHANRDDPFFFALECDPFGKRKTGLGWPLEFNYECAMVMTEDNLTKVRQTLGRHPSILAAYLHGSVAKGTARPDSDVDIALLPNPGKRLPLAFRLECAGELGALLGRTVDLGELSTRNVVYAKEVIEHGQEIFTTNRFQSDLFMATALAMYAELQQQRKEILDAYTA